MVGENPFFRELKPFKGSKVDVHLTSGEVIEGATLEEIEFKHLSIIISHEEGTELIRGNAILRLVKTQK
jgi:hypothetical protein